MKIYTKTGDSGETGLFRGPRVRKSNPRIEAYGDVDELNSILGLARCELASTMLDPKLVKIQHLLFVVGSELATPKLPVDSPDFPRVTSAHVREQETWIDEFQNGLTPQRWFILPGGCKGAATLHMARTVCRRAERRIVALIDLGTETVSPITLEYINRLSDLLFVMARVANHLANVEDVRWDKQL